MKILVTGATGFIGTALTQYLADEGHQLVIVTRSHKDSASKFKFKAVFVECDLSQNPLPARAFEGVDAVINLAGESIQGRWSDERKKRILQSRETGVRHLIQNLPATVNTLISVSAQGYYGDRQDQELTESAAQGDGFLAEVCQKWEAAFTGVKARRLVILRLGIVMSNQGGALKEMLKYFKMNLGAGLGDGKQWMSFISLNDLVRVFDHALKDSNYSGVINAVNNSPVTNNEFTAELCKHLHVIKLPNAPKLLLKLAMGEMSQIALFSTRLIPAKLHALGFQFEDDSLSQIFKRYL